MGANDAKRNKNKQAKRAAHYKNKREGTGMGEYRSPKSAASAKVAADKVEKPTMRKRAKAIWARITKNAKTVVVVFVAAATVVSASAYAIYYGYTALTEDSDYKLTGGIAATVEGVNILEDTITEEIMDLREAYEYDSDDDWAEYLASYSYTPETYRESVLEDYIDDLVLSCAIKEYEIEPTDEEIDEYYEELVEAYGDEDTLLLWMSYYGYSDEDEVRDSYITTALAEETLIETVAPAEDVEDEDVLTTVNENIDNYSGTKRSSHILISVDDTEDEEELEEALATAQAIIELLEVDGLTFEEAAAEYSDDSSADDGGDVGWDCLNTYVDEYQEALDSLEVGEYTTEPVLSDYGYHIILCTDEYTIDEEETDVDNIPEDIYDNVVETIQNDQVDADYDEWFEEYKTTLDIEIFDMPEDVPYNVDMSAYETDDEEESDDD